MNRPRIALAHVKDLPIPELFVSAVPMQLSTLLAGRGMPGWPPVKCCRVNDTDQEIRLLLSTSVFQLLKSKGLEEVQK